MSKGSRHHRFVGPLIVVSVSVAACSSGVSPTSFGPDFSGMSSARSVARAAPGKLVAVLLPSTTASDRYSAFDAPYFERAFSAAGVPTGELILQLAQGGADGELRAAQVDFSRGVSVLVLDPVDPGVGSRIETEAASHGVKVIDYDQLSAGGSRGFFIGFSGIQTGQLVGHGLVQCLADWKVPHPQVMIIRSPVPTGTEDFQLDGYYNDVLKPDFRSGKYGEVDVTLTSSDQSTVTAEFDRERASHPGINAALVLSDDEAAAIVADLQRHSVTPQTFAVTGTGANLNGLHDVLAGYQCGTTYAPIYREAQSAVTLALYLRADKTPPSTLVNGTVEDPNSHVAVPSILLNQVWVTAQNMKTTVVKDGFVAVSSLCEGAYAADCKAAGILP